jgi:hypothetical protein
VISPDGLGGEVRLVNEFVELVWGEVRQAVGLGIAPDQLDRIQFRCVRWQQRGADAMRVALEPAFDGLPAMGVEPVPHQLDRRAHCAAQLLQEREDVFSVEAGPGQQAEVGAHAPTRRHDERCDDSHVDAVAAALPQHRRVSPRRPAAPHHGTHQKAALVYEDDRRAAAPGVFFTPGQSSRIQRRICSSSRSMARRAGFCGLQPRSCSSRPMWST